jgi:uncharacterized protein YndB with AHSA1/START domain
MPPKAVVLDVTHTLLIPAPPARVMAAFFDPKDLAGWWQVVRTMMVARPLGLYAIEWETTRFKDDVLGHLGGTFHGTIIDYRENDALFIAEAYWQPPEGDPIGPMALEVHCQSHGNDRSTMLSVKQSGEGEGPRWARYFEIMAQGWEGALQEMKDYLDRETERNRLHNEWQRSRS